MSLYVFLGPTLSVPHAATFLDAVYCPPVQQGDIVDLVRQGASVIGIIDGFFEVVPSVWHKEILFAMSHGIRVCGAASMGALRAAELADYGMVGIGTIFGWYRDGLIEDDDEVVVRHGAIESGFKSMSDAMVNIRYVCDGAMKAGIISRQARDRLISVGKRLHYSDRSYRSILTISRREFGGFLSEDRFMAFLRDQPFTLKQLDAIALLKQLAALPQNRSVGPVPFRLQRTIYLDSVITD